MAIPEYEVSHSGLRAGVFTAQGDITDAITVQTTEGIKAKANTMQLKFSNPQRTDGTFKYSDRFIANDEISFSLGQGIVANEPVNKNLVMIGEIKEWGYDIDAKGRFLTVKCDDTISKLLDMTVQNTYPGDTASVIVKRLIQAELNNKLPPEQQLDVTKVTDTTIPVPYTIASETRRIRDLIDELSIDSNTGLGNFIYWIERDTSGTRFFRWEPKPSTVDKQINADSEVISFRPDKSVYDVKNFLRINCGEDDAGKSIWEFAANFESIAEAGWKDEVWPYPDAAEQARSDGLSGGDLIAKAKEIGKAAGESRLIIISEPKWKAAIEFRGNNDFNIANNVYVKSTGLGGDWVVLAGEPDPTTNEPFIGKKLRIKNITQKLSEKGWRTNLSLEEDFKFGV